MILTGKAKESFFNWINREIEDKDSFECEMNIDELNYKSETELNSLIIDFFDSKGLIISIFYYESFNKYGCYVKTMINDRYIKIFSEKRNLAIGQAIKRANDIYNKEF